MLKLLRTFALVFFGGLLALLALLGMSRLGEGWAILLALGLLIAAVQPWEKRRQEERRKRHG